ncbi:hypothetical protein AALO_G00249270 [Alosa alosa]|uniref:Uncharacterized protein n=1 Tax=Alosa alosa TaxID=278164 RepID=A0AAV6G0A0_9TELE|nr:uncharacterized protein zgc:193593 [Alosa alosa]KAG5266051.1 hypothetical protein AALO_G00249270 [Alosa alosa]
MFFRLPRLTPGYIRFLQTQAVHSVDMKTSGLAMPRVAVLLGALGIGVSGYSSRQLAMHHRPSARVLQWMDGPAAPSGGFHTASAFPQQAVVAPGSERQLFPVTKLP